MRKSKWLLPIVLALALIAVVLVAVAVAAPAAFGATSANVTITCVPAYITITNSPSDWTVNGTGNGVISPSTTYYSNPLGDTSAPGATVNDTVCRFTLNKSGSTVNINLTVNFGNFTGGDAMTNGNTGSAGATTFGAKSYFSGTAFSGAVIAKTSGSDVAYSNLSATTIKWGLMLATQTNAWTTGANMTANVTITATQF